MSDSAQPVVRHPTLSGAHLVPDGLVAALVFGATVMVLLHGGMSSVSSATPEVDLTGFLLVLGSAVPLVLARGRPLIVFGVAGAFSIVVVAVGYPLDMALAPAVALYHVVAHHQHGSRLPWVTAFVVGMFGLFLAVTAVELGAFPTSALLHTGLVAAGAWFAGERTRLRQEQFDEVRRRASNAEHEAERERMLAVAEERTRIARDLHDSVGHSITVIAVRAGGARLRRTSDPEAAMAALAAIEDLARDTAGEIDQIVGSLRDHPDAGQGVDNPIGLSSLDTLVASRADTGFPVTVQRDGTPRPLHVVEDQSAYRIIQEGLTNAAKHGNGEAALHLAYTDDALEIVISNPVAPGAPPGSGDGHGILGMRERATLIGGTLDVTRTDGRFQVRAHLPYEASRA